MTETIEDTKAIPDFNLIVDIKARIDAMCRFAKLNRNAIPVQCLKLGEVAMTLSLNTGYEEGLISALVIKAYQHWHLSQTDLALEELNESELLIHKTSCFKEWGELSLIRAMIIWGKGDYNKAMKIVFDAIDLLGNLKLRAEQGMLYWALGVFNYDLKDYDKSLVNYKKAMEIITDTEPHDSNKIAYTLIGIGCCYRCKDNYKEAMSTFQEALKISSENGHWMQESRTQYEIGLMLYSEGNFNDAEKALKISYEKRKANATKSSIISSLIALSDVEIKRKAYNKSMIYMKEALDIAVEIDAKPKIFQCHEKLASVYKQMGQFKEALDHIESFYRIRSEVMGDEVSYKLKNLETKYATMQAEKEADLHLKHNLELKKAHDIIAEKNKSITDSITYAKRIQQAKLPQLDEIYSTLENCFILYKPKDIVSGDFYYFQKKAETIFLAAADCTGHGVPGAFMSFIGSDKLDQALSLSSETSEILAHLNRGIKFSLKQTESDESTRDGMDIALCKIDIDNLSLSFAAANRPLWIIRRGQKTIEEIKGTKKAIGGLTYDAEHFDTHHIQLQHGDTFYIFTDGYADTFGGPEDKKLTTKRFKEILLSIQHQTMHQQEKYLDDYIERWKSRIEQIDDILVIGIRL